jgi:hypothetical protein
VLHDYTKNHTLSNPRCAPWADLATAFAAAPGSSSTVPPCARHKMRCRRHCQRTVHCARILSHRGKLSAQGYCPTCSACKDTTLPPPLYYTHTHCTDAVCALCAVMLSLLTICVCVYVCVCVCVGGKKHSPVLVLTRAQGVRDPLQRVHKGTGKVIGGVHLKDISGR